MNTQPNTPASRNEAEWRTELLRLFDLHGANLMNNANAQACAARDQFRALLLAAPGAAIDAGGQETVAREDFDRMSADLTRAKNLLVNLYDQISRDPSPEKLRGMIEKRTGSWFVWGADRDSLASRPEAPPASASPATVAQPVDRTIIGYTWTQANGKHRSVGAAPHPTNAHNIEPIHYPFAQPCASQGCGGAAIRHALQQIVDADDAQALTQQLIEIGRAALSTAKSVEHGATDGGTGE